MFCIYLFDCFGRKCEINLIVIVTVNRCVTDMCCQCSHNDDDAQFEQSLLTYVRKEELSTMKHNTRSLYRYPLDTQTQTLQTQAKLLDQLTCCLLCNYTYVNCRYRHQSTATASMLLITQLSTTSLVRDYVWSAYMCFCRFFYVRCGKGNSNYWQPIGSCI